MAAVKRREDLQTKETPYAYEYECKCGKKLILLSEEKPEKLILCYDCI